MSFEQGSPVSSPAKAFTPAWTVGTSANIDKNFGRYWRGVGKDKGFMFLNAFMSNKTGALGAGGIVRLTVPDSLAIDVSWWTAGGITVASGMDHEYRPYFGRCLFFKAGTGWIVLHVALYDADTANKTLQFYEAGGSFLDSEMLVSTINSSILLENVKIPIVGW